MPVWEAKSRLATIQGTPKHDGRHANATALGLGEVPGGKFGCLKTQDAIINLLKTGSS